MRTQFSAYPVLLTCLDRVQTILIGGGMVGERKVMGLLEVNARLRLISPQATSQLEEWAAQGRIEWMRRGYQPGDLEDAWLVIVATDNRQVNAQAAIEAQQRGILCNVADVPEEGNFHVPAVYRGEQEIIAVSTNDKKPALASALRNRIAQWLKEGKR